MSGKKVINLIALIAVLILAVQYFFAQKISWEIPLVFLMGGVVAVSFTYWNGKEDK